MKQHASVALRIVVAAALDVVDAGAVFDDDENNDGDGEEDAGSDSAEKSAATLSHVVASPDGTKEALSVK